MNNQIQFLKNSINRRRALSRGALARNRPNTQQKVESRLKTPSHHPSVKKEKILKAIERMDDDQLELLSRKIDESVKENEQGN